MLVNVGDAIFPKFLCLPVRGRQFIFHRRLLTAAASANSVQRGRLTSLLVDVHLREQIIHTLVDRRLRILVDIHPAVLVQIGPAVVINIFSLLKARGRLSGRWNDANSQATQQQQGDS